MIEYAFKFEVSNIQDFNSNIAYVLGKGYKYKCGKSQYSGFGWFDKLGMIDYNNIDNHIIKKVDKAIKWRRNVQKNYKKMKIYPKPSNINLYPNMCNRYDNEFRDKKLELAISLTIIN